MRVPPSLDLELRSRTTSALELTFPALALVVPARVFAAAAPDYYAEASTRRLGTNPLHFLMPESTLLLALKAFLSKHYFFYFVLSKILLTICNKL